jgi:hypothetical protein
LVESSFDYVEANTRKTYAVYSMDYGRLLSPKLSREGAELVDELNRGLERVVRVLPEHSELSTALRSQLTRHLVTLVGEGVSSGEEQGVKEAGRGEGWGVLVKSGCILDELLVPAPDKMVAASRAKRSAKSKSD